MCNVIGVKNVDYKKADGREVHGVEIVYTFTSKHYAGVNADRKFIGQGVIEKMGGEVPAPGDQIEFVYGADRSGRAYVNGWTKVAG